MELSSTNQLAKKTILTAFTVALSFCCLSSYAQTDTVKYTIKGNRLMLHHFGAITILNKGRVDSVLQVLQNSHFVNSRILYIQPGKAPQVITPSDISKLNRADLRDVSIIANKNDNPNHDKSLYCINAK